MINPPDKVTDHRKSRRGSRWLVFFLSVALSAAIAVFYQLRIAGKELSWSFRGQEFELLEPQFLALFSLLPLLVPLAVGSLAALPRKQLAIALLLRWAFLATLIAAVTQPIRVETNSRMHTVFAVDVSDSMPDAALVEALERIRSALKEKRPGDSASLVAFAQTAHILRLSSEGEEEPLPTLAILRATPTQLEQKREGEDARESWASGSDVAAAIQLAYGLFDPEKLKHLVVFSDGVETHGNLLAESAHARQMGTRISVAPNRTGAPQEIAIREMTVPPRLTVGEPFKLSINLYSSRKAEATLKLFQDARPNSLDPERKVELIPGINSFSFETVARIGGTVAYRAQLLPSSGDTFSQNNSLELDVEVPGRPRVLVIETDRSRAAPLERALRAQQFEVEVRTPNAFPTSRQEIGVFDFLVLSDIPANSMSYAAQALVEQYLRDQGGGLLFAGGSSGFGLGGWSGKPLARILPVHMDAERRKEMPSVALALVIDRSGSMSGLPMEMAKAACSATVETLKADDVLEVIAFDSTPKRYVRSQPARYASRIQTEIQRIQPGGGTAIFPALDMAYQDIAAVQARKKHVILLTDGRADRSGVPELVQAMLAEAITVTSVGLGEDADTELLRMIAEAGGGRYHHVPDPNSLPKIFTRETEMISKQSVVQDWFPVVQTARADFLKGLALNTAPMLRGYVATQMKSSPAQQLLSTDTGEPILARWRVGLGQSLAWTSDLKSGWASDWLRWPAFGQFIGQLVRENMRKQSERELRMETEVVGDQVRATVDAFTDQDTFDNGLTASLYVSDKDDSRAARKLPMPQVAPGRYETTFALESFGAFTLRAVHSRTMETGELKQIAVSYGQVSYPYPLEYSTLEPDLQKLTRLAAGTRGWLDPTPIQVFDPQDERLVRRIPLWSWLAYLALGIFLLDLLFRRVRLFDRKFQREG